MTVLLNELTCPINCWGCDIYTRICDLHVTQHAALAVHQPTGEWNVKHFLQVYVGMIDIVGRLITAWHRSK